MTASPDEARFRVSGLLKLQSRPGIFVCGEIVQGTVKAGMEIIWPLHGEALTMAVPVCGVEFIDYAPGVSGIGLEVRFDDEDAENEQLLRDIVEVGIEVAVRPVPPATQA
jgi:hypothetical protein